MDKEKAPCYKCAKRFPGCHGSCDDYARADRLHQEEKEKIRQAKAENNIYMSYVVKSPAAKKSKAIKKRIQKRG